LCSIKDPSKLPFMVVSVGGFHAHAWCDADHSRAVALWHPAQTSEPTKLGTRSGTLANVSPAPMTIRLQSNDIPKVNRTGVSLSAGAMISFG
jgi:hypothetical protein